MPEAISDKGCADGVEDWDKIEHRGSSSDYKNLKTAVKSPLVKF
jgi:hypothetical protein